MWVPLYHVLDSLYLYYVLIEFIPISDEMIAFNIRLRR